MNPSIVELIARAILYEGYVLYPYRPSVKNRQRWTFGGLLPTAFVEANDTGDLSVMKCECLVSGREPVVDVKLRFLHLMKRQAGAIDDSTSPVELDESRFTPVDELRIGDRQYLSWEEAVEREVAVGPLAIPSLRDAPHRQRFEFSDSRSFELLRDEEQRAAGAFLRTQKPLSGEIGLAAEALEPDLYRVELRVANHSPLPGVVTTGREAALQSALVSTHAILHVENGEFISLLETPGSDKHVATCRQTGLWPVLVGEAGHTDTMLASPIILYDYPQVAAESPGDLFDGSEIDEILTLRIMTLTDDEKRTMAAVDARTRALLKRTSALSSAELFRLHGTSRGRREPSPANEAKYDGGL